MDARDGAAEDAAVVERDLDVGRARRALAEPQRVAGELLDRRAQPGDHRLAEPARREQPARDLGRHARVHVRSREPALQQPRADAPLLEVVELDRQRVADLLGEVAEHDPEPLAQKCPNRVFGESDEVVELDQRGADLGQRAGEERRRRDARRAERAGALERDAVEAPGALGHELAGREVARVERLQRVLDEHPVARAPAVRPARSRRPRRAARRPAPPAAAACWSARPCPCR